MASTNIIISSTNGSGKKESTSVLYVNGGVSNAIIKEFAMKLVELTQNSYAGVTKITKEEIY